MTRFKTIGSLQLHEDLAHERREWKLQRVGWALMALALLAAVLGLFGHGPLSETASASADGALTVRHQRFERYQAPSEYDIGALPALAAGGVLVLRVEPALLARIEIERFEPAPQQVRADGEALLFAFATVPGKPARVRMFFRPKRSGRSWRASRSGRSGSTSVSSSIPEMPRWIRCCARWWCTRSC